MVWWCLMYQEATRNPVGIDGFVRQRNFGCCSGTVNDQQGCFWFRVHEVGCGSKLGPKIRLQTKKLNKFWCIQKSSPSRFFVVLMLAHFDPYPNQCGRGTCGVFIQTVHGDVGEIRCSTGWFHAGNLQWQTYCIEWFGVRSAFDFTWLANCSILFGRM